MKTFFLGWYPTYPFLYIVFAYVCLDYKAVYVATKESKLTDLRFEFEGFVKQIQAAQQMVYDQQEKSIIGWLRGVPERYDCCQHVAIE